MLVDKWLDAIAVPCSFREFGPDETYSYPRVQRRYLLWCRTGRGSVEVNGESFRLIPGTFLAIPWNHSITYFPSLEQPYTLGCIHLIPDLEEEEDGRITYLAFHHYDPGNPAYYRRRDEPLDGFEKVVRFQLNEESLLLRLSNYVVERFTKLASADQLRMLARSLMYELYQTAAANSPAACRYPPAFQKMLDHIEDYLEAPINFAGLSFHSRWSTPTIYRAFRKYLGATPGQYIMERRLLHAAKTLRLSTGSIAALSRNLQFSTPGYFTRCFKKRFGVSPRAYREMKGAVEPLSEPRRPPHHIEEERINPLFVPKFFPESLRGKE